MPTSAVTAPPEHEQPAQGKNQPTTCHGWLSAGLDATVEPGDGFSLASA